MSGRSRTFRAFGEAFERAAARSGSCSDLTEALAERSAEIDVESAVLTLQCLVGVVCKATGKTPRSVLVDQLAAVPSDAFWRAEVEVPS